MTAERRRRRLFERIRFYAGATLWLPAGLLLQALVRFDFRLGNPADFLAHAHQLLVVAPFGLPLALACRWLWRKGYRRSAWAAFAALVPPSALAALLGGLLGPLGIAVFASIPAVPVLLAAALLRRRGRSPPGGTDPLRHGE